MNTAGGAPAETFYVDRNRLRSARTKSRKLGRATQLNNGANSKISYTIELLCQCRGKKTDVEPVGHQVGVSFNTDPPRFRSVSALKKTGMPGVWRRREKHVRLRYIESSIFSVYRNFSSVRYLNTVGVRPFRALSKTSLGVRRWRWRCRLSPSRPHRNRTNRATVPSNRSEQPFRDLFRAPLFHATVFFPLALLFFVFSCRVVSCRVVSSPFTGISTVGLVDHVFTVVIPL